MARTANIYTRVDPEIKEQAERILSELGIPMSSAIGMFLHQVVLQRGIPFEMKLNVRKPLALGELTREQLDAELQKGQDDIDAGRLIPLEQVEADMRRKYGI